MLRRGTTRARAPGQATRRSPFGTPLADVDALEHPEGDGDADQRGAAVADERQRDAGDGHHADDHPDVDDELEEQPRADATRKDRAEWVPRSPARDQDPP